MRRMLSYALTMVSLLLFAASVAIWVRSYGIVDQVVYSKASWAVFAESGGGQFRLKYVRATPEQKYIRDSGFYHSTRRKSGPLREGMMMPGSQVHVDRFGFWIVTGERWRDYHYAVFFPAWFPTLLTLVIPACWLRLRVRTSMQTGDRLCPRCNYDLRATPDRCPECGVTTSHRTVASSLAAMQS